MAENGASALGPARFSFTRAEIVQMMKNLFCVFDMVRLVDPETSTQWMLDDGGDLKRSEYRCWKVWNKSSRCQHCVSGRAMAQHEQSIKFEFMEDDLHHVTAKYVEVDGRPCVMEMISRVPDETMLEGHGRRDIVDAITRHNRRVYLDPLTGAYNRRYLEEMYQGWESDRAVAIIDSDDFKHVNDSFGHGAGDQVLKGIVDAIVSCIRSTDAVIRFGGDEFVVIFDRLPRAQLPIKLEQILRQVRDMLFEEAPGYRQTVSVGAAFGDGGILALIERADRMLYRAKASGKNRVCMEENESLQA